MKPPAFDYSAPTTLDEALGLLHELGDEARPLAGGQSLVPLLSLRLARPSHLIDLAGVAGLASIRADNGHLIVGAMVRELAAERSEEVHRKAPLLAEALPLIGHPAIRSRGTVGGSLAHADPSAELPAVAVALGAELVVESQARGTRTIPAAEFFVGFFQTALEPDEILTGIAFPAPAPGTGSAIAEVARRHGDFAMVGAAAVVRVEADRIAEARLVLTGVSATPWRATAVEELLVGADASHEAATNEAIAEASGQAATGLSPPADVHGSSSYRRHVAGVLARRTLTVATQRAMEAA